MPSPFPGMDPFLESPKWEGFHSRFVNELADRLVPLLRPRYEVEPEQRIYVEQVLEDPRFIRGDVTLLRDAAEAGSATAVVSRADTEILPSIYTTPLPSEERETFLIIRELPTHQVVTIIEVLSPTNKRPGSVGRKEYLAKRLSAHRSKVNLVEIDLLRGGERSPTMEPLKSNTDYCVFISRRGNRPIIDGYEWPLAHRLPTIPIPLAGQDPDVQLDLQQAFTSVYDRGGYDYSLDYSRQLRPALREVDVAWVGELLKSRATV
jgi:hypothetical protein